MTHRLYYTEPYRTSFDGTVVSVEPVDGRLHVVLDQTAFYPTSGGQPFDIGTLGGAAVTEVIDREDGTIAHVVSGTVKAGEVVSGAIDWARRFDHMQQHTGQHVLSAAFDRLFGVRTESFHMGAAASSIDLAREVSATELEQAEDEANRIVWEDRMVHIRFASAEEAAAMPLRKDSLRTGPLRLIDVEDFDLSACGGTHVARTGAIGIIAIGGAAKFRGGSRVEFLCGGRALDRFRLWRDALAATQRYLSVAPEDMAAAIERMQADAKAQQKIQRGMQDKLATHEAQTLIAKGTRAGARLVMVEAIEGWDAQGLKAMAVAAAAIDPAAAIALFTTTTPALVVIAKGPNGGIDAGAVLKELVAKFGGKGGGKPDLAQGGGLTGTSVDHIAAARALMS
ncbi:MAG: alanyl-tRNA editing protein [Vicinamibacterales bacterium]|nr:alanyl-tRNA editing protein [Vicinamibacterales bacterium]